VLEPKGSKRWGGPGISRELLGRFLPELLWVFLLSVGVVLWIGLFFVAVVDILSELGWIPRPPWWLVVWPVVAFAGFSFAMKGRLRRQL
jgi:hypothetical protein